MKLDNLNSAIKFMEDCNCKIIHGSDSSVINTILVEIGGKPISKNVTYPGSNDGSNLNEIQMYAFYVALRSILEGAEVEKS